MATLPKDVLLFYEHIVRTQHKSLHRLAMVLLSQKGSIGSISQAEDAVQEAFTIAWEKREEFYHHPNPAGWLTITLKNVVKNMVRADQRWAERLLQIPPDSVLSPPGADLELEGFVPSEDLDLLKRLYLRKETYEEICQDLGIKKSALAMRVKRIKAQFRKNYAEIEKNIPPECEQTGSGGHDNSRGGSKT